MTTLPKVIHEDVAQIVAELVHDYEFATGKTLQPAQIERIFIDLMAYREMLLRAGINDSARQNLVRFARLEMLAYLGEMVECAQLPAQAARTTLRFSLAASTSTVTIIAKGTRIEGGGFIMVTTAEAVISAGAMSVDVLAQADTVGPEPNGLLQNVFKEPFDELPEGVSCTNITVVGGGSYVEDTERYRERVMLAWARPSAGSRNAYRYIALTADIRVIDVSISTPSPGFIRLAVLTDPVSEMEVVAAVHRAASADDNRPLTDRVETVAAAGVDVPILVYITPLKGISIVNLPKQAQSVLAAYKARLATKAGLDVVASQIGGELQALAGVKRVQVVNGDVAIEPHQYADLSWIIEILAAQDE